VGTEKPRPISQHREPTVPCANIKETRVVAKTVPVSPSEDMVAFSPGPTVNRCQDNALQP
jgi:hypothetical protein